MRGSSVLALVGVGGVDVGDSLPLSAPMLPRFLLNGFLRISLRAEERERRDRLSTRMWPTGCSRKQESVT